MLGIPRNSYEEMEWSVIGKLKCAGGTLCFVNLRNQTYLPVQTLQFVLEGLERDGKVKLHKPEGGLESIELDEQYLAFSTRAERWVSRKLGLS